MINGSVVVEIDKGPNTNLEAYMEVPLKTLRQSTFNTPATSLERTKYPPKAYFIKASAALFKKSEDVSK